MDPRDEGDRAAEKGDGSFDGTMGTDVRPEMLAVFRRLKERLPILESLLAACSSHWGYEDPIYRLYHQSYKVFAVQGRTVEIVKERTGVKGRERESLGRGVFPAVNIFSDKDGCVVRLEVPGVPPDQITIETQGRTLTVAGKRDSEAPAGSGFHRRERDSGAFSRSLQLPDDLDVARTEASYAHGLLTLRVPKKAAATPRQITVKAA